MTVLLNVTQVSDICDENCHQKSKSDRSRTPSNESVKSAPDKEILPDADVEAI